MTPVSPSHFFFGLLLVVVVLAVFIFLPFLTPIVLAAAIAVVFAPLHRFIVRKFYKDRERSNFGALTTLLVVIVIIFVPALLITAKIYTEVQSMYGFLIDESGRSQAITALNNAAEGVSNVFLNLYPAYSFDSFNITEILQKGLEWLFGNLDTIFSGASKIALSFFVMLLAMFYFLRDGRELKRQIISLSPLGDDDDEKIFKKLERTIFSIFGGSIAVGILQGILTGIGFALFGVPNPALWGSIASITALIPGIGTALVLIPGILYLFFSFKIGLGFGLLAWGILAVGLIDNILGPTLVGRGTKIHPFLVLFGVLGGIQLFGPAGFIAGPLILSLLFALAEIYSGSQTARIVREEEQ